MCFMANIFRFFSRGGIAFVIRAGLWVVARAFKASPATQAQPRGTARASDLAFPAAFAAEEENLDAGDIEASEVDNEAVGREGMGKEDSDVDELLDETDNDEGRDSEPPRASSGHVDVLMAASPKHTEAVKMQPSEAAAVYALLCMLDITDVRLQRAMANKMELETEVAKLKRRIETADDANTEQIRRLKAQLQESRARECELRVQLRWQTNLTELRSADMKYRLDATRLQYEWLLKTTKAANSELREKALCLELRVADLEADLEEAQVRPNAEVAFLLSRASRLELELEAAYARLNEKAGPGREHSTSKAILDPEAMNAPLEDQLEDDAFRALELALEMATKQSKEASAVREFREIELQREREAAATKAPTSVTMATAAAPPMATVAIQAPARRADNVHGLDDLSWSFPVEDTRSRFISS